MASVKERQVRSRTGCLVCKSRKVKCDEKPDGCDNCGRLGVQCPGYDITPSLRKAAQADAVVDIFETAGVPKKVVGSCQECRTKKYRCTRERPKCRRCLHKHIPCTYGSSRELRAQQRGESPSSISSAKEAPSNSASDAPQEAPQNWLYSETLPNDEEKLKVLSDVYFQKIHPFRSLAFIHPPTFMQALDAGKVEAEFGLALVHIMFALAARCIKLDSPSATISADNAEPPGERWAKKANDTVFRSLGVPYVQNLMALVLLCEYESRYGQNSTVFMLSGCCFRMAQLLRLNSEAVDESMTQLPTVTQVTERESRRRLMWSCYILDVVVGSGVESLIMSSKSLPNIQLPCNNDAYVLQRAPGTGHLLPDGILILDSVPVEALGLEAYFVYVISLREQILRFIRITELSRPPWSADSGFTNIVNKLDALESNLPSHLKFNKLNLYIHQSSFQQGAFYAMHLAYHQCYCDLYRVVLPGYQFPITKLFAGASIEFIQQCQERCYHHADSISKIFKSALSSEGSIFTEPLCGIFAYESTKIQVIFVTTYVGLNPGVFYDQIAENIETNLQSIEKAAMQQSKNAIFIISLCRLLKDFGFSEIADAWRRKSASGSSGLQLPQDAPEFEHLHFMTTFQQTWKEILWPKPPQQEGEEHFEDAPAATHQTQTGSSANGTSEASYQLSQLPETAIVPEGPFGISNTQVSTQNADQYLQMAEDMGDYLTWEPFQVDLSGTSNFIYQ